MWWCGGVETPATVVLTEESSTDTTLNVTATVTINDDSNLTYSVTPGGATGSLTDGVNTINLTDLDPETTYTISITSTLGVDVSADFTTDASIDDCPEIQVTIGENSNVTSDSIKLHHTVDCMPTETPDNNIGVYVSENEDYSGGSIKSNYPVSSITVGTEIITSINFLTPSTTYYAKLVWTNGVVAGDLIAEFDSFTTEPEEVVEMADTSIVSITPTVDDATASVNVVSVGPSGVIARWSNNVNGGDAFASSNVIDTGVQDVVYGKADLNPTTMYYFSLIDAGDESNILASQSFTTPGAKSLRSVSSDMTVKELKEYAKQNSITLSGARNKTDILNVITNTK